MLLQVDYIYADRKFVDAVKLKYPESESSINCAIHHSDDKEVASSVPRHHPLSDKESPCGDVEKLHHNITLTAPRHPL